MNYSNNPDRKTFDLSDQTGIRTMRLVRIVDIGTTRSNFGAEVSIKRQGIWSFEFPEDVVLLKDGTSFVRTIDKYYTQAGFYDKTKLRIDMTAARGRAYTQEQADAFQPRPLLGLPFKASIVINDKGKLAIGSFIPFAKGEAEKVPTSPTPQIFFDLDEFDQAEFDKLPTYYKDKVIISPEYKELMAAPPFKITPQQAMVGNPAFADMSDDDLSSLPF